MTATESVRRVLEAHGVAEAERGVVARFLGRLPRRAVKALARVAPQDLEREFHTVIASTAASRALVEAAIQVDIAQRVAAGLAAQGALSAAEAESPAGAARRAAAALEASALRIFERLHARGKTT